MKTYHFLVLVYLLLQSTSGIAQQQPKEKIDLLNRSLIFDLYMNFELANKNDNLAAIIPYVESSKFTKAKTIETISNMGGEDEKLIVKYDDDSKFSEIDYTVLKSKFSEERKYRYQFEYDGLLLKKISLNGRLKFELNYSKKGKIRSISRRVNRETYYTVYFLHNKDKLSAQLRFDVLEDGKTKSLDVTGYVKWTKKCQLTDYKIYRYEAKDIQYNSHGDISNSIFSGNFSSFKELEWKYDYDKSNNWIKRSNGDSFMKRTISN